jgi:hypothetical protein
MILYVLVYFICTAGMASQLSSCSCRHSFIGVPNVRRHCNRKVEQYEKGCCYAFQRTGHHVANI